MWRRQLCFLSIFNPSPKHLKALSPSLHSCPFNKANVSSVNKSSIRFSSKEVLWHGAFYKNMGAYFQKLSPLHPTHCLWRVFWRKNKKCLALWGLGSLPKLNAIWIFASSFESSWKVIGRSFFFQSQTVKAGKTSSWVTRLPGLKGEALRMTAPDVGKKYQANESSVQRLWVSQRLFQGTKICLYVPKSLLKHNIALLFIAFTLQDIF